MRAAVGLLSLVFLTLPLLTAGAAEKQLADLPPRTPWTTSRFHGRPEPPPPYRAERIYPHLRFNQTTVLDVLPGTERFLVGERGGKIYLLPSDRQATSAALFLDASALADRLNAAGQAPVVFESLYGMTFDPDFARTRYCYVCYVVRYRERSLGQHPEGTRVVRFRVSRDEPPRCELDSEELLISWLQGGHNGGCLKFGPDGCLYISTGDGGSAFPPDGLKSGQDLNTLLAKILRIDVRHRAEGRAYTIPADNPFVSLPGARGETWAYGLRNPWKMSFDRQTGALWVGDVGWELWELVYCVHKGDNFGWSIVEGSQTVHAERPRGPTPIIPPTMQIPHTEGASITGGFVYRGHRLPELAGSYVFGDWETRRVWGAKVLGDKLGERNELIDPTVRIVDFAEDREGELYLLDHDDGAIYTLVRNEARGQPSTFPRRLSQTGLFRDVARHEPAAGVLPFSIQVDQWSDGASAERLIAVPGDGTIFMRSRPRRVPGSQFSRAVEYPTDTVLLKTLSLPGIADDADRRRRIETQVLHYDGREWQAYTYAWNDEQTDAELVERFGRTQTWEIPDAAAPGGKRRQTWVYASRGDCLRCHNPWSEYALAFNLPQLNRTHTYDGLTDNQIRIFRQIGLIADAADSREENAPRVRSDQPRPVETLPRLAPLDSAADTSARARAYLHVNCGHCHRFNGGGSSYIFLQHDLPLAEMKAINVRPTQGTFGIHDAQVIAPGDPYRSVLYFRMAKTGPGHMPHLGATHIDKRGLAVVRDWIRQLPVRSEEAAKVEQLVTLGDAPRGARADQRRQLIDELMASPSPALLLADALREGRLPEAARQAVLAAAVGRSIDPAVRDLFETFLPEEQRVRRLGEQINPAEILPLAGDAERGRLLYHESTVLQCRNCHRIAGRGTELGPDLDSIGKKYDREKLLEQIIQPSLQVDPKYTMWLAETKSGVVLSGLLTRQDAAGVVLRDLQNKLHTIPASDLERIVPQAKSPMPDLQLRDFTAQQVADLLSYLATLKADAPAASAP